MVVHLVYGVKGSKPSKSWLSEFRVTEDPKIKLRVLIDLDPHFSITVNMHDYYRGLIGVGHMPLEIERYFPELAPLIKWHLTDPLTGPMHYIANTLFLAGNRDHNGLVEGEQQVILGPNKIPTWVLQSVPPINTRLTQEEKPDPVKLEWVKWTRIGEGKERDFATARLTAVWPEATEAELSLPPHELRELLEARLPQLMIDFNNMLKSIGFPHATSPNPSHS